MKLVYKAITKEGKSVAGVIDGKDVKEAVKFLRTRELLPIRVIPQEAQGIQKYLSFLHRAGAGDVVFFTRQLSSMLASGLTLMQAMTILKDQIEKPAMSNVVNVVIADIEDGQSFSKSLEKHPKIFSAIYISLIKAAETSGLLDKVLARLAENLEKQEKLKSTIKSALMYPAIVITGMFVVVTLMMIFVVPQLTLLYGNLNIPLPLPTQIIIGLSNFVIIFWPLIIGMVVVGGSLFTRWHATVSGRLIIDDIILKLPIFGPLIRKTILTEFTRTLGLLVGSGTLVVEALKETADVAGNVLYRNAILALSSRVEKGITVGDAMAESKLFPTILIQMVKIGEETGKMDEALVKVSEYFEREVEAAVKNLTTAMEPIIMVVLGIGVAFLIISIITPIYNLTNSIQ